MLKKKKPLWVLCEGWRGEGRETRLQGQKGRCVCVCLCVCVCVCICLSVSVLWPSHLNPEKACVCVCVCVSVCLSVCLCVMALTPEPRKGKCVCVCVCVLWSQLDPCSVRAGGPTAPLQLPELRPRWSCGPGLGAVQKDVPMPASYRGKKHGGLHPSFPFSSAELDQMSKRSSTRRGK